jgi:multiple sugar transport system substrate-binding protein
MAMPAVSRRRLVGAAGALAGVGVVAACTRQPAPGAGQPPGQVAGAIRLGIYGPQAEIPAWEGAVKAFRDKQPAVQVEIEHVASNFQEKLVSLAAADSLWDVMRATDEPLYGNVERGVFRDITDFWTRDLREINPTDFVEGQLDFWRWDKKAKVGGTRAGRVYGTPRDGGVHLIIYNKRVFQEAGLPPPPRDGRWTWTDYLDICRRLTKREGGQLVRAGMDFLPDWTRAISWVVPRGLELLDTQKRKSEVNQPAMVEVLKEIQDYRFVHRVAPMPTDFADVRGRQTRLARGVVGTIIEYALFASLRAEFKDDPDNWEVAHVPRDPRTGRRAARCSWGGLGIGAGTRAAEAAWQLTKFIISADGQKEWARLGRSMPCRLSVLKSEVFNDPKTVQDESIWIEGLSYQKYQPITEYWDGTDRIWRFWWRKMMDEGLPPVQAVAQIDQQVNHLLQTGQEPTLG